MELSKWLLILLISQLISIIFSNTLVTHFLYKSVQLILCPTIIIWSIIVQFSDIYIVNRHLCCMIISTVYQCVGYVDNADELLLLLLSLSLLLLFMICIT